MNNYVKIVYLLFFIASAAFSEDLIIDDTTWNVKHTLYFTPDTEMYLVKGTPYTGVLIQDAEYLSEYITVRGGFAVKDSSIYYIDKKTGKKYCTDVETTTDSTSTSTVIYENASYIDKKYLRTGNGKSVYTENGKICMTVIYDSLSYSEYGKCIKQDWFDELLD